MSQFIVNLGLTALCLLNVYAIGRIGKMMDLQLKFNEEVYAHMQIDLKMAKVTNEILDHLRRHNDTGIQKL